MTGYQIFLVILGFTGLWNLYSGYKKSQVMPLPSQKIGNEAPSIIIPGLGQMFFGVILASPAFGFLGETLK